MPADSASAAVGLPVVRTRFSTWSFSPAVPAPLDGGENGPGVAAWVPGATWAGVGAGPAPIGTALT